MTPPLLRRILKRMGMSGGSPILIALVEDHAELRSTWMQVFDRAPGFRCVGAFASGEEALSAIPPLRPSVVLMDLNLPGISGVECTARLKAAVPQTQILVLTAYGETELIFDALQAGATGYLLKRTRPADLLQAVREVVNGGAPMSPEIARKVVESFRRISPVSRGENDLTPREREVLTLLSSGLTDKEIAQRVNVGYETVRSHMKHIYDKLHVHSRTEAVVKFLASEGALRPIR